MAEKNISSDIGIRSLLDEETFTDVVIPAYKGYQYSMLAFIPSVKKNLTVSSYSITRDITDGSSVSGASITTVEGIIRIGSGFIVRFAVSGCAEAHTYLVKLSYTLS